ncbi:MAG: hypothetical protein J0I47_06565 [Sphingomonas sp.]|uniref:hypothetical protein n=1 Tax=Sphingomonas sp. TaxID=28214 RepID=UPI001ACEAFDF|nr:hypothetical protein [Sphingomonas sp.]MBN8807884.1 hypothetical protein [Sphingomonas sp.]
MGINASLRAAVKAAGGTPTDLSLVHNLRILVSLYGSVPTQWSVIGLLREAVSASGETPTDYDSVPLLRQLIAARGGNSTAYDVETLYGQLAELGQTALGALSLSNNRLLENSVEGTVIGSILGKKPGSTLSLMDDVGRQFALAGSGDEWTLTAGTNPTDYETASVHHPVIRETLGGVDHPFRDSTLTVEITNVFERPALPQLALSSATFIIGQPASGTITGATDDSIISVGGVPDGLVIDAVARTWTWDGTGPVASSTITLTETLEDSPNSPRVSAISATVIDNYQATPPVLTRTSVAGANPMSWSGYYANVIVGSDKIRCRWRVNDAAWTYETDHLVSSDDFFDSEDGMASFAWPLFDATDFAAGSMVEVQEGVLRGATTAWSAVLSDTMAGRVAAVKLASEFLDFGYASGTVAMPSAIACRSNDKVLVLLDFASNGAPTLAGVDAAGVTFAPVGGGTGHNNHYCYAYFADVGSVASLDNLRVTTTGSTLGCVVHVIAVRNAAAGPPDATNIYFDTRAVTNADTHDVDADIPVPDGGIAILWVSIDDDPGYRNMAASGAVELDSKGDGDARQIGGVVYAKTVSSANVTIPGSPHDGYGYGDLRVVNLIWSL